MDESRIEETTGSGSAAAIRKPYRTPNKLMVLGAINTVVLGASHAGSDGLTAPPSAGS